MWHRIRWKSSAEQSCDSVSQWWAILLEAWVRFEVIAPMVACISCLEQLRNIDFTLRSYLPVKDGGWNFTKKPTRTNRPRKQRPMKLIWLVSLVFVKVHMARDLAVLVMSSGESRGKSKSLWRNDATNSLILGVVKTFSRSGTVYDQQMTKEFPLSCVAL